ncbi:hypothetical protein [Anaerolentibacter hominis]|uniref:hypothetical protein n=1 Tax=Anaerolentibacter hominis TaxID=3079009 RepID=UPI0031B8A813
MKRSNKYIISGLSVLLAGAMVTAAVFLPVETTSNAAGFNFPGSSTLADAIQTVSASGTKEGQKTAGTSGVYKDETVYATADPDGSIRKIVVSDWLKNAGSGTELNDISSLKEIENIKGEETFTQDGRRLTWKTNGTDIYYQGTSEEKLPVAMNITYELNGKNVTADQLAGKNGSLKMTWHFSSQDLPFTMITAMMLPAEHFNNVRIEHGKLITDAKNIIAVGIAFPGLNKELDIDRDTLDFPDTFTITADVTELEIGPALTFASCDLLDELNLDDFDGLEELKESMDDLAEASGKLADGSAGLKKGADTLKSKTGDLKSGAKTLTDGLSQLSSGADSLNSGIKAYTEGADTLADGVKTYVDGAGTLSEGITDYVNGTGELADGLKQLEEAVNAGISVTDEQKQAISSLESALSGLSSDKLSSLQEGAGTVADGLSSYNDGLSSLANGFQAIAVSLPDGEQKEMLNQLTAQLKGVVSKNGAQLEAGAKQVASGTRELNSALSALAPAMKQVTPLMGLLSSAASLPEAVGTLRLGAVKLTQNNEALLTGAASLKEAGPTLRAGANELTGKSKTLRNGAGDIQSAARALKTGGATLADGIHAFADGTSELAEGADELAEGMKEFDRTGIQKLKSLFGDDLGELSDRLDSLQKKASAYQSFSGIASGMEGSVKFVIETSEIK